MSFATELAKSVSGFRVLVDVDSIDTLYAGRFSFNSFTPIGGTAPYDGRLLQAPDISIQRDSSYFGLLVYSSSSISLNNADGEFDDLLENYNIIGARVRIWIGYESIALSEYVNIYTGYIESITIDEESTTISVADLRKRLKTGNSTDALFVNAVQGVENILLGNYSITAGSTYFDVSAMTTAKALAYEIYREAPDNDTVDSAIEDCVKSTMGFFYITETGKYSYKIIDTIATSVTTITKNDIINPISIQYDEGNIIASATVESPDFDFTTSHSVINTNSFGAGVVLSNGSVIVAGTPESASTQNIYLSPKGSTVFSIVATAISPIIMDFVDMGSGIVLSLTQDDVYRSTDYGSSWTFISSSFSNFIKCGAKTGTATASIASYTASVMNVYKTTDSGSSWSLAGATDGYTPQKISGSTNGFISILASHVGTSTSISILMSSVGGASTYVSWDFAGTNIQCGGITTVDNSTRYASAYESPTGIIHIYRQAGGVNNPWYELFTVTVEGDYTTRMVSDSNGDFYFIISTAGLYKSTRDPDKPSAIVNAALISTTTIGDTFLLDVHTGEVYISSVNKLKRAKFDQNKHWALDTSHKASVLTVYGVDTLKKFSTNIERYSDALDMAADLVDYFSVLRGEFSVTVPIKYYSVKIGDNVDVEIWRAKEEFLGTKKCEVLGKGYNLSDGTISFNLRIIS